MSLVVELGSWVSGYRALGRVSQSRWSGLGSRVTEARASLLVGRLGIGGWV